MKTKAKNAILQAIEILNEREHGTKYRVEHIRKDRPTGKSLDWGMSVFQRERRTEEFESMFSNITEVINIAAALGIMSYVTVDTYDVPDDVTGTKNKPYIRLF